jgi:hypothetical protein
MLFFAAREGCAKGVLEINGRTIELSHAAYRGRTVHRSSTPVRQTA